MFLNDAHLLGRSGISRLMFTSLIILILSTFAFGIGAQGGGGTLRVAMVPPENLDPATGTNDPEVLFNRTIYDFLIETRPDGTLMPNLATDWSVSDDGLEYTFSLAEGVTFHDGSAFSSADVVYTFNRLVELESQSTNLMGAFEISAPDASTVVFTLPEINADFLFGVATQSAYIIQDGQETPNVLAEGDNPYVNFNGTGPFVLTDYSAGESATFEANGSYFKEGEPTLDSLEFLFFPDKLTQIDALRSGVVDFVFKLEIDQIPTLQDDGSINIASIPSNLHPVIRIRSDEGALGEDVRVRQAFKLATNREELLETVQEGLGIVGNNDPVGPKYGEFYPGFIEQPFDPARACELIQEATGQERIESDFYVVDAFNYESLGIALQQQWAEGCIDVNVLLREEGLYYADTEWLEVDLGITGWGDRPVPQGYFASAFQTDGPFNETHFSDPEVDELIALAASTPDTADRAEVYAQLAAIFAERGPIIIPWFASVTGAVSTNVEGLDMHPFAGLTDFRNVTVTG